MGRAPAILLSAITIELSALSVPGQTGALTPMPGPGYRDGIWHHQEEVYSRKQPGSRTDATQRGEAWILFDKEGRAIKAKGVTWGSAGGPVAFSFFDGNVVTVEDRSVGRDLRFTLARHQGQPPLFPEWLAQAHSNGQVAFLREVRYLGKRAELYEVTLPADQVRTDDPYVKDLNPRVIRIRYTVQPRTFIPLATEWTVVDEQGRDTLVFYQRKSLNEFLPATAENLALLSPER